ncbi:hypothetical protein LCGC14_1317800 [marine sediment metagenome]|uniref:Uncharacterized protein n=1 Tax=marine sediment metagenome TaxID=412755 RepID=A0A0F9L5Q8_9ZZZZ
MCNWMTYMKKLLNYSFGIRKMQIPKGRSNTKFEVNQIYPGWVAYHSLCYYSSFDIKYKFNDNTTLNTVLITNIESHQNFQRTKTINKLLNLAPGVCPYRDKLINFYLN